MAVWLIDAVLAVTAIELVVLIAWRRWSGRGLRAADVAVPLSAGVCLLVTARLAATGAPWPWLAASLAAAGLCHGVDVVRRWPRESPATTLR